VKRFKPSEVVSEVNANINGVSITSNLHVTLYKIFDIRPPNGADDPFDTKSVYCLYDETHGDYVYEQAWVDFLIHFMQTQTFTAAELRSKEKTGDKMDIKGYEI
jgi:hypothetical protein